METTEYTLLSPALLPKAKTLKKVKHFVLVTFVAVGCCPDTLEACSLRINDNGSASNPKTDNTSFSVPLNSDILSFPNSYTYKKQMLNKLCDFYESLSRKGWDGYNASPIEKASYFNARKVVMSTPEETLKFWNVFPSPNGTISFEFKEKRIAAMSVGNTDFSYVAIDDSGDSLSAEREFDEYEAANALIAMSNLFGYFG